MIGSIKFQQISILCERWEWLSVLRESNLIGISYKLWTNFNWILTKLKIMMSWIQSNHWNYFTNTFRLGNFNKNFQLFDDGFFLFIYDGISAISEKYDGDGTEINKEHTNSLDLSNFTLELSTLFTNFHNLFSFHIFFNFSWIFLDFLGFFTFIEH
jgi:hypothetical protein